MGLRNLEDNSSRTRCKHSDLSYREGRTAWSTAEPFLQVRFHRNIAASSLAADCNIPQRPPAFLISNWRLVWKPFVITVYTHTQWPHIRGIVAFYCDTNWNIVWSRHVAKMVVTHLSGFSSKSWREQRQRIFIHQSQKILEPELSVPGQETRYVILHLQLRRRARSMQIRGEERGEVDPATQQSIHEPTKEGEGAPSYELLIQGHAWGEKEKEKEEKKRRRREDKRRSQLCTSHPGTRQEGGDGVAAKVHELVVVEIHNLHYTPSVNGFSLLCHPLSEDCCCQ